MIWATVDDTDPEASRVQIELMRRAAPARRLQLALSLSESVVALSRAGIARRRPDASAIDLDLEFVAIHYGSALAAELRAHLLAREA
jgi:hypothetical protein